MARALLWSSFLSREEKLRWIESMALLRVATVAFKRSLGLSLALEFLPVAL